MLDTMLALKVVLPQFIFVYGFLLVITLSQWLSLLITGLLLALLLHFRIAPVDPMIADDMLQADRVSVIAHRGAATDAPENTLGAIRTAKENGADGVEFDLSYTKDGVPILMHDDTVDRTTNGTGQIEQLSWSHVQTLNAAVKEAAKPGYSYEKVPTLEEAVQVCLKLGLRMYIDCKADAQRTASVIAELYKKYPDLYRTALVCSFYPQVVYMVRRADPKVVTALIHRPWFMTREQNGNWQARPWWVLAVLTPIDALLIWVHAAFLWFLCGNSAFSVIKDGCNKFLVQFFASLGIKIILWTVNDPAEKAYFTKTLGCDIITDTLLDGSISNGSAAGNKTPDTSSAASSNGVNSVS